MARKRLKSKRWIWGLVGVLVVVVVVVVGVVIWKENNKGNTGEIEDSKNNSSKIDDSESETSSVVAEIDNAKHEEGESEESKFAEEEVSKKRVTQYEGENPNQAEELSGVITYAGVTNGVLMIRASIDQYLNGGSCELLLKREGSVVYNDTAAVVGDVSTATCEGFDVPVSGLGGGGIEIIININANDKSGIIRGEVSI